VLGVALVAVVIAAAWVSTVAIDGLPWQSPYRLRIRLPPGAPLLHSGDEVRIAGERAGQVSSVTLAGATLELSRSVGTGAVATIRPRGLAGAVYVDLGAGRAGRPLPPGSAIRGVGTVQLTDVIAGFDRAARRALDLIATGYGTGLAGQGAGLNDVIARAPGVLGDLTSVLRAVRPGLARTIGDATTVAGAIAPALGGLVSAARAVFEQTPAVAGAIDALPAFEQTAATVLPGADALLKQAQSAASELTPGIEALARALPPLHALERRAPAVATLQSVAQTAAPVLRALSPALADLRGPAAGLTPLSTPVFTLANVLIPYRTELIEAPLGFTRWGDFRYDFGTGAGHRAVRFSMVLTCALARDPYPLPGAAGKERRPCP
jgi:ABC-type transporter Mla subunit MlaD